MADEDDRRWAWIVTINLSVLCCRSKFSEYSAYFLTYIPISSLISQPYLSLFCTPRPRFVFRNYTPHADELKEFMVHSASSVFEVTNLIYYWQKEPPPIPDLEKELVELCLEQVKVDEASREVIITAVTLMFVIFDFVTVNIASIHELVHSLLLWMQGQLLVRPRKANWDLKRDVVIYVCTSMCIAHVKICDICSRKICMHSPRCTHTVWSLTVIDTKDHHHLMPASKKLDIFETACCVFGIRVLLGGIVLYSSRRSRRGGFITGPQRSPS